MQILFLSTPVGPLGSGLGGGVELTLKNIAIALAQNGHHIKIIAPERSYLDIDKHLDITLLSIPGTLQDTAQNQGRQTPIIMPSQSVLAAMLDEAQQQQTHHDIVLNFAYDWLPFYLTPWLTIPIAHLISMGSLTKAIDDIIQQTLEAYPLTIGVHSQSQADTFPFGDRCRILSNGLDLTQYKFQPEAQEYLAWIGRIAPEKGIEDAIAASQQVNIPLKVFGIMPDQTYWKNICSAYPEAPVTYEGFLSTQDLQQSLGHSKGLLMTPKWIEAFGNVTIEALACGVPVIAYDRGGPSEIVNHGTSGWLVPPDDIQGLVSSIQKLPEISRQTCRKQAERQYSLNAMGQRIENWLTDILR
ncbi:MAG: glycosyltransferase family 4 protein [Cyanobacteria bacterium P01_F01_bin.150]